MIENSSVSGLITRYIHPNHQGSCNLETDDNGDVITYEEYHPFGTTSYQATNGSVFAAAKRYRYTGKERDSESGLYYYGARYYVPWLCRFISCDPKSAEFVNQSSYNYCFNNPINLVDPSGMAPEGPDDPPNNNVPPTNGTSPNKLAGVFEPAKADPVDIKNVRAAGTDGGAGATTLQNMKQGSSSKASNDAKKEDTKDNLGTISTITGILAISADATKELGGLEKAKELIESGKFQTVYNEELKTWSLNFQGNKSVKAEFVSAEKVAFAGKAAKDSQLLSVVKGVSTVANIAGLVFLTNNVINEGWTADNKMDALIAGVGFIPEVGWAAAGVLTMTKFGAKAFEKSVFEMEHSSKYITTDPNDQFQLDHFLNTQGYNNLDDAFRNN